MQNRTFGPYLEAIHRNLVSVMASAAGNAGAAPMADGEAGFVAGDGAAAMPPTDGSMRRFRLTVDVRSFAASMGLPLSLAAAFVRVSLPTKLAGGAHSRGKLKMTRTWLVSLALSFMSCLNSRFVKSHKLNSAIRSAGSPGTAEQACDWPLCISVHMHFIPLVSARPAEQNERPAMDCFAARGGH
jgi:hypothetical protein